MGKREKFIRAKLIDQLVNFNDLAERIFSNEELSMDEVEKIDKALNSLEDTLAVYRFIRELRDSDEMQIEFLEMFDKNEEASEEPSKTNEVVKSIEKFEEIIAEDVEIEDTVVLEELKKEVSNTAKDKAETPKENSSDKGIDREKAEKKSIEINDRLSAEPSIADKFQGDSVKSLKESVGLNDRFQFASELFKGNMEDLKVALNKMDEKMDLQQALEYLELEYSHSKTWDRNSEVYKRFMNLLKRRFPLN